jgi:hypothetical protein
MQSGVFYRRQPMAYAAELPSYVPQAVYAPQVGLQGVQAAQAPVEVDSGA